jgi:hypothetical protein
MSDEKLLRVSTAFGPSRYETLLLTVRAHKAASENNGNRKAWKMDQG